MEYPIIRFRQSRDHPKFVMEVCIPVLTLAPYVPWSVTYQYKDQPYMYGCFHDKFGTVVRPSKLYNGHSRACKTKSVQDFTGTISLLLRKDMGIYWNIQENNKRIKSYKVFLPEAGISGMDK